MKQLDQRLKKLEDRRPACNESAVILAYGKSEEWIESEIKRKRDAGLTGVIIIMDK